MALVLKAVTLRGSPEITTLTDITPGRARPSNYPLAGTPLAVAWPLIAAGLSGIAAYTWGRNSASNAATIDKKVATLDAQLAKQLSEARKLDAEADALEKAANDPKGISREVAEDLARRKIGLEETNADTVQKAWAEEAQFRDDQRSALTRISNERARQLELENDARASELNQRFQSELLAPYRVSLEAEKLQLQRMLVAGATAEASSQAYREEVRAASSYTPASDALRVPGGLRSIGI